MKKLFQVIVVGAALLLWMGVRAEVQSLRGVDITADSTASEARRYIDDDQLVARSFVQQPPVIPHSVEGLRVNLRNNRCLSCHSWAKYKGKKATKISITHFRDRDGNELSDVAGRRYFCLQCHVPQTDKDKLIVNEFEPLNAFVSGGKDRQNQH